MNDKLLSEFVSLGCTSVRKASITLQVYFDLCEVKRYWDVEYFYDLTLDTMYLTAKKTKSSDLGVFIPIFASQNLTYRQILDFIGLQKDGTNSVYLAIVDADSTCVYYKIKNGLEDVVETPKESVQDKREKLDVELKKVKSQIEQCALYGLPFSIPSSSSAEENA